MAGMRWGLHPMASAERATYGRASRMIILILLMVAGVILWLARPGLQSLFQVVARAAQERREEIDLYEHEVERLDRIRNPSKYLGK